MDICIDIQPAVSQQAGVGRYTRMLVEHLAQQRSPGDSLRLFYFDFSRRARPPRVAGAELRALSWCPGRVLQRAWRMGIGPRFESLAGSADLYHFPNFIIPPCRRGRTVVTIHDVSFLRFPEAAEARNRVYLAGRIRDTVERADLILTDSEFSAAEICELLPADPEKIRAIHLGLAPHITPAGEGDICQMRRRHGLERPYLLSVGTLEPRKNYSLLVEIFERLEADVDLVIAGMRGWKFEPILRRIAGSQRREQIHYLEYVPDRELPALYSGAEWLVFPSLYEGFGFPPLEAMACGTPVVAAAAGSLPEVLGEGARLVENYEPGTWARLLDELLADHDARDSWSAAGRLRAADFCWADTARRTWAAYREAMQ